MTRHFCTYFNKNFLVRGLALYRSLVAHVPDFRLYVLCFDAKTHAFLTQQAYPQLIPVSRDDFEAGDPRLKECQGNRSMIEYFFTCTPSLPLYILNTFKDVELISYVDADMFFFSSPEPVFQELGEDSILIIPHRFSARNSDNERFGLYNVGFLSFRNDRWGRRCLEWWRERCIEWCYDREEKTRFADQKYLDRFPELFQKVCVLKQKGTNLAPWNVDNFSYRKVGSDVLVDGDRLILYHFNSLNKRNSVLYELGTRVYGRDLDTVLLLHVYKVYIHQIRRISREIGMTLGANRCKRRHGSFVRHLLAVAEMEEAVIFPRYFFPIRVSHLLRPLTMMKRMLKTVVPGPGAGSSASAA